MGCCCSSCRSTPKWEIAVTEPFTQLKMRLDWRGYMPTGPASNVPKLNLTVYDAAGNVKLELQGGGTDSTWKDGNSGETTFKAPATAKDPFSAAFVAVRHVAGKRKQWRISPAGPDGRPDGEAIYARRGDEDVAEYMRDGGAEYQRDAPVLDKRILVKNYGRVVRVWREILPMDILNGENHAMAKNSKHLIATIPLEHSHPEVDGKEDMSGALEYTLLVHPEYAGPTSSTAGLVGGSRLSREEEAIFLAIVTDFFWSRGISCIAAPHEEYRHV